jgi:hypothetical protein
VHPAFHAVGHFSQEGLISRSSFLLLKGLDWNEFIGICGNKLP